MLHMNKEQWAAKNMLQVSKFSKEQNEAGDSAKAKMIQAQWSTAWPMLR